MQDDEDDHREHRSDLNDRDAHAERVASEMSDEAWLEALLELNPWAREFDLQEIVEAEQKTENYDKYTALSAARGNACWDRWQKGKDVWNDWSDGMAALRPKEPNSRSISRHFHLLAFADFSERKFENQACFFSNVKFPGDAWFANATFSGDASFDNATFSGEALFDDATFSGTALFEYATFSGDASFDNVTFFGAASFDDATFSGDALFRDATFSGPAWFGKATFSGDALFGKATFSGDALFRNATISGTALFDNATFSGGASFRWATFSGAAWFGKATFSGDASFRGSKFHKSTIFDAVQITQSISFEQAVFEGPVSFSGAAAKGDVSFRSAQSAVAFSLASAHFAKTPDFIEATFHEPPRLDDCVVPDPLNEFQPIHSTDDPRPRCCMFPVFAIARDADEHARFRKLRKMAADAKDHENELKFNGYEIAARRFWVDKPNEARFWLGWLYGLFSDYGQSVKRPFLTWIALIWTFWAIFLVFTPDHTQTAHGTQCHEQYRSAVGEDVAALRFTSPGWQALSLSLRNASVIAQPDTAVTRRIYGCLYGFERAALSSDGDATEAIRWPVIPPSVTYLSALQSVLSAIFLFLTGLGLRNTFRMK